MAQTAQNEAEATRDRLHEHPTMTKTLERIKLEIEAGLLSDLGIIVMLGENGTGKTTFTRMLMELMKPGDPSKEIPELNMPCEPQTISPSFGGSARDLLLTKIRSAWTHSQLATDVTKPMMIDSLLDQKVKNLCAGELH